MKILYALNSGQYGGMENHVLDLVRGMVEKGHEVHVWCPSGPLTSAFDATGAKITEKKIGLDICPSYIFSLSKYLEKNEIEILHAHELKAVTNSLLAGYLAGTKVKISHTHTPISEWKVNGFIKIIDILINSAVVNLFSTKEIALTESRKAVKIKEGIKKAKLVVIKNANAYKESDIALRDIELRDKYRNEIVQKYGLQSDVRIWGVVGRLSDEKGHRTLLKAFKTYQRALEDTHNSNDVLLLAGGGPLQEELQGKINSYGLQEKVIITGRFADEDKKKLYSAFDYFIHPSLAEGFGIVLIEAMASKIPVLASDLEVFKEVAQDTILYFKTGDEKDLAEKMMEIKQHADSEKVQKAYELAKNTYSLEKFLLGYENLYLSLLR